MANTSKVKPGNKRLMIAATLMFLVAGGLLGNMFYRQRQAKLGRYARPDQVSPDMAVSLQKARMKRVVLLRDKWKSWAAQNKEDLSQMLDGDKNAQSKVWAALPILPEESGTIRQDDVTGGISTFSWQPVMKSTFTASDPAEAQRKNQEVRAHAEKLLNEGFSRHRDIPISQSRNSGAKTLSLWASGRVTETETVRNTGAGKGQPASKEVSRELFPPYEFLSEKGT
ncbi:MAG TPA: hypothetical protein VGB77_05585 [Abditibacteriaceae bacterium]|jgi:hypothetical protein